MNDTLEKILQRLERLEQQLQDLDRKTDQYATTAKDNLLLTDESQRLRLCHMEARLQKEMKRRR